MRAASDQRTPDSAGAPSPRSSSNSVKAIILRRQASLVLSAALAIAGALAGLIPYVVVYFVANELFLSEQVDRDRLLSLGLWAGAAVIAKILCKAFANAVSHTAAYRILADLRLALAERLSQMPLGRVQVRSSGHLRKVLQDDVEQLELGLSHAIPDIAAAIAVPLASLIVMFVISWPVASAALAVVLLSVVLVAWGVARSAGVAESESGIKEHLNTAVISFLRGMKVIRGFLPGKTSFAATDDAIAASEQIENTKMQRGKWQAVASTVLTTSAVLFVLPTGLWCVHAGYLTPSALIFFLLVGTGFAQPLMSLMISMAVLQYQIEAGLKNISEILDEPDLPSPEHPEFPEDFSIDIHDVSFAYEDGPTVLHEINLNIPEGTSLALVGPSGGGKSTLLGLLARFYDVNSGSLRLGGVDLRDMDPVALMQRVAYVQQDEYIFAGTLWENIRMARPEATDEEITSAAEQARVGEFVGELDNGWRTVLPAGGGRLSGGQRQRISIARAILKGASVILLDEATAFLDPESEAAVTKALAELRSRTTMITVAHRLGTVTDYDQIAFLAEGRITATGTHEELLQHYPDYAQLWASFQQARGWRITKSAQEPGAGETQEAKASAGALKPGDDTTTTWENTRVVGLKNMKPIRQWLHLLGEQRSSLWRKGLVWIIADGMLTSSPLVVTLFALLEVLSGQVGADMWWRYGLILLAIFIVRWLVGVGLATVWWPTTNNVITHLRQSILTHLRRIPLGKYDRLDVGQTATLLVADLPLIDFVNLPAKVIVSLLQPLLAMTILLILDWRLALAALAGLPVFFLLLWLSDRTQNRILGEVTQARSNASSELLELVQGTAVLRANPDAPQAKKYRDSVEALRRASVAMAIQTSPLHSLASVVLELGFAALVMVVCYGSVNGDMSNMVALLGLVISLNLYRPYQELMDLSTYRHLQGHIVNRISQIWDIELLSEGNLETPPGEATVTFNHVSFAYLDNQEVLRDATLMARTGEITALIGPSGAGKSTVANLVARFWDVGSGSVRIGDADVRDLTSVGLASQVTAVYQDVYLFSGTIRENLCLGNDMPDARLEQALQAAQAWDFVSQVPDGLDTRLTEGGTNLSGGQRQRISIARALLKNAPILLLDEAVASVDPETEIRIQQALSSLVTGRTVIVVAHRLNTICSADRIVVLAHHGVEAMGTHEELLDSSPVYHRLWMASQQ